MAKPRGTRSARTRTSAMLTAVAFTRINTSPAPTVGAGTSLITTTSGGP
jgi:hypothetical protein